MLWPYIPACWWMMIFQINIKTWCPDHLLFEQVLSKVGLSFERIVLLKPLSSMVLWLNFRVQGNSAFQWVQVFIKWVRLISSQGPERNDGDPDHQKGSSKLLPCEIAEIHSAGLLCQTPVLPPCLLYLRDLLSFCSLPCAFHIFIKIWLSELQLIKAFASLV